MKIQNRSRKKNKFFKKIKNRIDTEKSVNTDFSAPINQGTNIILENNSSLDPAPDPGDSNIVQIEESKLPVEIQSEPVAGTEETAEVADEKKADDKPDQIQVKEENLPLQPDYGEEFIGEKELSIINELIESDLKEYEEEIKRVTEVTAYFIELKTLTEKIPDELDRILPGFSSDITEFKNRRDSLEIDPQLKLKLDNRMESIELCQRMLQRLNQQTSRFFEIYDKFTNLEGPGKTEWPGVDQIRQIKIKDFDAFTAQRKKEIENCRNINYQTIRHKNESVNALKKAFFDFFQRYYFPVIDGLESGKRYFEENQAEWKKEFSGNTSIIEMHFEIYDKLISQVELFLNKFHIEKINVTIGEEFNEELHEPFMVEEGEGTLENKNIIKEVNAKGYKFLNINTKEEQVIRFPQVIVIKK